MRFTHQRRGGGAPRRFLLGRQGQQMGGIAIAVVGAGVTMGLAGCGPATPAGASATPSGTASTSATPTSSATTSSSGTRYSFKTLDNPADLTFNQLLGINNRDVIAGYFGSGAQNHPNQGYVLNRTLAGFAITSENVKGTVQTQVTGLNDRGVTVGFSSTMNNANQAMNDNTGFYDIHGTFHSVSAPSTATSTATPPVSQLLGVNNQDRAVGFYNDASGNAHGFTYSIYSGTFHSVTITGATSLTPAAINNANDVAGFYTKAAGTTDGFLRTSGGRTYTLAAPGASMTQALGVNDLREVVGVYTVGTGSSAVMHGFTWTPFRGFRTVDDPQGTGTTTINGVNDNGDLVGFYVDSAGSTDGFAAVPTGQTPLPGLIGAMTSPSTSPSSTMSPAPSTSPTSTMSPAPSTSPTSTMSPAPTSSPTVSTSPTFSGHGS